MVEQTCARQAEDRGFTDVVSSGSLDYGQLESELLRIHEFSQRIVARTRGRLLRDDVESEDLMLFLWGLSRVAVVARRIRPDIWRRYLALMLDWLRPAHASTLPVGPMLPDDVAHAIAVRGEPQPSGADKSFDKGEHCGRGTRMIRASP